MKPLSGEAGRLLEVARAAHEADGPSKEARARLRRQLLLRVGAGAAAGLAGASSAQAAGAAGATLSELTTLKVLAGVVLVGASSAGVALATRGPERAGNAERSAEVARLEAGVEARVEARARAWSAAVAGNREAKTPGGSAPVAPEGERPAKATRAEAAAKFPVGGAASRKAPGSAPGKVAASGAPEASSLEGETVLLRNAQRALRSGDAKGALDLLDAHEKAHPGGALREEQRAARVLALCAAGEAQAARAEAERFLRDFPGSPHAARVRASCASGAPPEP